MPCVKYHVKSPWFEHFMDYCHLSRYHTRELMATSAEIDGLLSLRFGDDGGISVIEFDRSHVDFNGRRNFFGLDCSLLCHKSLNEER